MSEPAKEDIERIQLFEACRQVEHHLRALAGTYPRISVVLQPTLVSVEWSGFETGESLFDAIIAAKETKPA